MKNEMFNELLESMQEMDQVIQGGLAPGRVTRYAGTEVRQIRNKMDLSRDQFAALIGISRRTLENWELDRRFPSGPAKALLRILHADHEHVLRALCGKAEDTAE